MKVAIIGLIGSGKSSVIDYLKSLDKNVFDCDEIAKDVYKLEEVKQEISSKFGVKLDEENNLDKEQLSTIIFGNDSRKDELEKYVHLKVLQRLQEISMGYEDIFVEVSAFKDSVVANFFDIILGVACSKEIRIERIKKRNGYSLEKIESIMKVQPSDEDIEQISNYIIKNEGEIENIPSQVDRFLEFAYAGIDANTLN